MAYFGNKPADQAIQIGSDTILSSHIDDGVIVDADINASASISVSKTQLAGGTGLTLSSNTLNVDASQTQITSVGTLSSLTLSGDLTLPQKIVHSGDTDTYLSFGTDSLSLYTGGTNVVDFIYGAVYIKQNNKPLVGYNTGGSARELIKIDGSNVVQIAESSDSNFGGGATFAGNVGIKNTAFESWHSNWDGVLQIGETTSLGNYGGTDTYLLENAYHDGSWKYQTASHASKLTNQGGSYVFSVADSGSADATITWKDAFTINNNGNSIFSGDYKVGIGQGSPTNSPLEVNLTQSNGTVGSSGFAHFGSSGTTDGYIQGISLGYRESNANYRKIAIASRGRGDGATRSDLVFLVDTANDQASATLQDVKLKIDGLTGDTTVAKNLLVGNTSGGSIYFTPLQGNVGGISWGGTYGGAFTKLVNIDSHNWQDVAQISFNNASWGTVMFEIKFADEGSRAGVWVVSTQGHASMTVLDTVTSHGELANSNLADNFQLAYVTTGNIKLQAKNWNSVGGMGALVTIIGGNRSSDNDIGITWLR